MDYKSLKRPKIAQTLLLPLYRVFSLSIPLPIPFSDPKYLSRVSPCSRTPKRRLKSPVSGAHFAKAAAPMVLNISSVDRTRLVFSDHKRALWALAFVHPKGCSGARYLPQERWKERERFIFRQLSLVVGIWRLPQMQHVAPSTERIGAMEEDFVCRSLAFSR